MMAKIRVATRTVIYQPLTSTTPTRIGLYCDQQGIQSCQQAIHGCFKSHPCLLKHMATPAHGYNTWPPCTAILPAHKAVHKIECIQGCSRYQCHCSRSHNQSIMLFVAAITPKVWLEISKIYE